MTGTTKGEAVSINASVAAAGETAGDATVLNDDEVLETKVEYAVELSQWQSEAQWQQQQQQQQQVVLCGAHGAPWTRLRFAAVA